MGNIHGIPGHVGASLGVAGDFFDRCRHLCHGLGGSCGLLCLCLAGLDQLLRGGGRLFRRGIDEYRRFVDRSDQLSQRIDRVVDRVCYRAGDVLGDRSLNREVAVGQAR